MPNIPNVIGWTAIILVLVVVAVAIYLNNYRKAQYDALVKQAKAKGIDILSK